MSELKLRPPKRAGQGAPGLQICAYFTAVQRRYTMALKHSAHTSQPEFRRASRAA